ncbi:hypothetical protein BIW11_04581, partial [Tropilaelaps mercedesae]
MQDASSPLSERSPSPTSSQGEQTPPRGDKGGLPTTLLPLPVKPITLSPSLAKYYKEKNPRRSFFSGFFVPTTGTELRTGSLGFSDRRNGCKAALKKKRLVNFAGSRKCCVQRASIWKRDNEIRFCVRAFNCGIYVVLITHMTAWQAEQLERQATRLQSELFTLASVHCSAISADLKMARSMVRLAEIQATLQEQRAMFLQQQIAQLEEK